MRALRLFWLSLKVPVHRLAHDLGREVTVALSSLVLAAVFAYVFNDFLNVQVAELSRAMRDAFAIVATWVVLVLGALGSGMVLRRDFRAPSLVTAATMLGEDRGTLRIFLVLRFLTVLALFHGIAWYVVERWLATPSSAAATAILLLLPSLILALWPERRVEAVTAAKPPASTDADIKPVEALLRWRLTAIFLRNRTARVCLLAALMLLGLVGWAAAAKAPLFVGGAAALTAGLFGAFSLAFQAGDDLTHAWIERALGVSHDEFVGAYERLALVLALALAILAGGAWGLLTREPFDALRVAALAALAPVITPWLLFQIDARRPVVSILVLLIVALFLGTAILAHWLSLALVPLLRHFALNSQAGKFYRA